MFTQNIFTIEHHVCKAAYPVAKEYATRRIAKRYILVNVSVAKDKTIDRRVFPQIIICKLYAKLIFGTKERSIALNLMLNHTMARPGVAHPQSPTGMDCREATLQETAVEYLAQQQEPTVLGELVAVSKKELLAL